MIEQVTSKVYVLIDEKNRVIRCEGGYTTPADLTGWVQIDEGTGDRYNLCQSHYFDGGLYTSDGIPRYKLVDGEAGREQHGVWKDGSGRDIDGLPLWIL